jgi:hypothetical protein
MVCVCGGEANINGGVIDRTEARSGIREWTYEMT